MEVAFPANGETRPPEMSTMARIWATGSVPRARERKAPREMPMRAMRRGSTVGWAAMWAMASRMVASQRGTWVPSWRVEGSARVVPVRSK